MVVGQADLVSVSNYRTNHAYQYVGGYMKDIGVLSPYITGSTVTSISSATRINNLGQIVGNSYTSSGFLHAFFYDQGQMNDIGTLPGGYTSKASGLNDLGQVVGWSIQSGGPTHAFLYDSTGIVDLGTLGGTASYAYDINNAGQIVGDSWTNTSRLSDTAYVYSNGMMYALGKLGDLPAIWAQAINESGQIAGYAGNVDTGGPTVEHGYLLTGGTFIDLGNASEQLTNVIPTGMNNLGQIVGSVTGSEGIVNPFLYSGGVLRDLNTLIDPSAGWTLTRASAINNNGQIAATGKNTALQQRALLLSPRPNLQNLHFAGGHAQFSVTGMTGITCRIEYALTLPPTNWLPLTNFVVSVSPAQITDTTGLGTGQRFYRAVQP